jgi:hypothetical protein
VIVGQACRKLFSINTINTGRDLAYLISLSLIFLLTSILLSRHNSSSNIVTRINRRSDTDDGRESFMKSTVFLWLLEARSSIRVAPRRLGAAAVTVCFLLCGHFLGTGAATAQTAATSVQKAVPIQFLYLAHGGCVPAVTHPPSGQFLLLVRNRSGEQDIQLVLHAADGSAQAAQALSATQRSWVVRLDLSPGKYTLDSATSEHHCVMQVE